MSKSISEVPKKLNIHPRSPTASCREQTVQIFISIVADVDTTRPLVTQSGRLWDTSINSYSGNGWRVILRTIN